MSVNCQQAADQVGNGVAAALRGVDCIAGEASAAAFGRLFAPGGSLGTVLTLVLTLFIVALNTRQGDFCQRARKVHHLLMLL